MLSLRNALTLLALLSTSINAAPLASNDQPLNSTLSSTSDGEFETGVQKGLDQLARLSLYGSGWEVGEVKGNFEIDGSVNNFQITTVSSSSGKDATINQIYGPSSDPTWSEPKYGRAQLLTWPWTSTGMRLQDAVVLADKQGIARADLRWAELGFPSEDYLTHGPGTEPWYTIVARTVNFYVGAKTGRSFQKPHQLFEDAGNSNDTFSSAKLAAVA